MRDRDKEIDRDKYPQQGFMLIFPQPFPASQGHVCVCVPSGYRSTGEQTLIFPVVSSIVVLYCHCATSAGPSFIF